MIIFFSKFRSCHFFYFNDPQRHAKFQKKLAQKRMPDNFKYLKNDFIVLQKFASLFASKMDEPNGIVQSNPKAARRR